MKGSTVSVLPFAVFMARFLGCKSVSRLLYLQIPVKAREY